MTLSASVIVCTLNRCDLLDGCIESLAGQRVPSEEYEIVVVDNGSSDGTVPVVKRWMDRVANLRLVHEPTIGLSRARNAGITTARGAVLAFLDDDAVASDGWLDALVRTHARWPEAGAVGGPTKLVLPGPRPSWLSPELEGWFSGLELGDRPRLLGDSEIPFGTNMSVLREALADVGGFAVELGRRGRSLISNEEKELFSRLRDAQYALAYQPAAEVWHRVARDRLSRLWLIRRAYAQGRSEVAFQRLRAPDPGCARVTRKEAAGMLLSETIRAGRTALASLIGVDDEAGVALNLAMRRAQRIGEARETLLPSLTSG